MPAILVSWTFIASCGQSSPAEGLVILSISSCLWIPISSTIFLFRNVERRSLRCNLLLLGNNMVLRFAIWFSATLYR